MASEKQQEANKNNAQSAGVRTEEGKKRVRHNALRHGLTANLLVSTKYMIETEEQFNQILEGLEASFQPRNAFEQDLIVMMAKAQLKLNRFDKLDSSCWRDLVHQESRELQAQHTFQLDLGLKYKQSMEAQYFRALESLYRYRQMNQQMNLIPFQENSV